MPEKQEANARSQPDEGLQRLQEHRQVRAGAGGRSGRWDTGMARREAASPERLRPGHGHATPRDFSGAGPAPGWLRPAQPRSKAPEAESSTELSSACL